MPYTILIPLFFSLSVGASAATPVDSDHDGIVDTVDRCPNTPQLKKVDPDSRIAALFEPEFLSDRPVSVPVDETGCARDSDGDQVADHLDFCPEDLPEEISAGVNRNGCPLQSDADGTPDYRDRCPGTPRGVRTDPYGCPRDIDV
jgi:OOP family OmpA-OmpF porin